MASSKLGLVAKNCNTTTGGQDYLELDGGLGIVSLLERWFRSRTKVNGEKEAPSMELCPQWFWLLTLHIVRICSGMAQLMLALAFHPQAFLEGRWTLLLGLALVPGKKW
jgi:hypothetical protein